MVNIHLKQLVQNPFFWIGIAFVVAIISLIVLLAKQYTSPVPVACKNNESLCGDTCYDGTKNQCIGGTVCPNDSVCKVPGQPATCCAAIGEFCDNTTGQCVQTCKSGVICTGPNGAVCCKDKTDICADSKQQCCDPQFYTDADDFCCTLGTGDICVNPKTGKKSCCPYASGQRCGENGVCVVGCPDKASLDLYKCPGEDHATMPAVPISCSGNTPICSVDCSKTGDDRYVCVSQDVCQWDDIVYSPDSVGPNKTNVCMAGPNSPVPASPGSLWLTNVYPGLVATATDVAGKGRTSACTRPACVARMRQKDSAIIVSATDFDPTKDGVCKSDLDCSIRLANNDLETICPTLGEKQCCKISDSYSGQVCPDGQFCDTGLSGDADCFKGYAWDPSSYRCIPSNDANAFPHVTQCLQDACNKDVAYKQEGVCGSLVCSLDDWRRCGSLCPDWAHTKSPSASKACNSVYTMPGYVNIPRQMTYSDGAKTDWTDHKCLVLIPTSIPIVSFGPWDPASFTTAWLNPPGYAPLKDLNRPNVFYNAIYADDNSSGNMPCSFSVTLRNVDGNQLVYYIHSKTGDGITTSWESVICAGSYSQTATCAKSSVNTKYTAVCNKDLNAAVRIGNQSASPPLPAVIFLSLPSITGCSDEISYN